MGVDTGSHRRGGVYDIGIRVDTGSHRRAGAHDTVVGVDTEYHRDRESL